MYGDLWLELKALGADDMLVEGLSVSEQLLLKVEALLAASG